jgi:predicted DNA binding CopG/RHH family protein
MKKLQLTPEEKKLDAAIDRGEYVSVHTPALADQYAKIAKDTFAKQRTVNVRISERNLLRLKAAASRQGMTYQTYITGLIQKHAQN